MGLFGKINDKKCRKGVARFKLNASTRFKLNASNGEYLNKNK